MGIVLKDVQPEEGEQGEIKEVEEMEPQPRTSIIEET